MYKHATLGCRNALVETRRTIFEHFSLRNMYHVAMLIEPCRCARDLRRSDRCRPDARDERDKRIARLCVHRGCVPQSKPRASIPGPEVESSVREGGCNCRSWHMGARTCLRTSVRSRHGLLLLTSRRNAVVGRVVRRRRGLGRRPQAIARPARATGGGRGAPVGSRWYGVPSARWRS